MKFSEDHSKQIVELINAASKAEIEWIQRILLISSTLFGILISLFQKSTTSHNAALLFALSIVLLSLGILLLSLLLYSYPKSQRKATAMFVRELGSAYLEGREPEPVFADKSKFSKVCEKLAYMFLVSSVLSLAVYVTVNVIQK